MNSPDTAVLERPTATPETTAVRQWLDAFEAALNGGNADAIAKLFTPDSHWRDLLAFTWDLTPHLGVDKIAASLAKAQPATRARAFNISLERTPPRRVRRHAVDVIEAIIEFETAVGTGSGVLRLLASNPTEHAAGQPARAWVLLTTLEVLRGYEEKTGKLQPKGEPYSRDFRGGNWLDQRNKAQAYADREPAVLVGGGGQAGLSIAARLGQLDVDTLVVDKHERVGDNWRKRYHSLALHNQIQANHLPYMLFPPTWPKYIPKDMLANWFEAYAWSMQINFWTGTEFTGGTYDEAKKCWHVTVRRADGSERTLHPRHVIFANGVSGIPKMPSLPGLEDFKGDVMHSHSFSTGARWAGKKALVLGTGNSAHDVAQDLHSHGAHATLIQRGSTTVVSVDPSARLNYALYDEGRSLDDTDLIATASTYPLTVKAYQLAVERMVEFDKDLIAALKAKGFKYDLGEDLTGHQMKYRRRGGGYYLDVGCSGLIIKGEVGLLQWDNIECFVANGVKLKDGSLIEAELLVLATGYHTQRELVRRLLGEEVAAQQRLVGQGHGTYLFVCTYGKLAWRAPSVHPSSHVPAPPRRTS